MSGRQYAVQVVAGIALTVAGAYLVYSLCMLPEYRLHDLDAGGRFALNLLLVPLTVGVAIAMGMTLWRGGGAVALVAMGAVGVLVPVAMFDPAPDYVLVGLRDVVLRASALSGLACVLAMISTVGWLTQRQRPARPRRP